MEQRFFADLCDGVDIPTDGTLSRVMHSDEAVRLVLFGFDAGQELTEHTAAVTVIVQVLSGAITVEMDGETHRMKPSSWLLIPGRMPHSVVADTASHMLLTMLRST